MKISNSDFYIKKIFKFLGLGTKFINPKEIITEIENFVSKYLH